MHFVNESPFKNDKYSQCILLGHNDGCCKSANKKEEINKFKPLLICYQVIMLRQNRKFITVCINRHPVKLQLDTASDISLISDNVWSNIDKPYLESTTDTLRNISGYAMRLVGKLNCSFS